MVSITGGSVDLRRYYTASWPDSTPWLDLVSSKWIQMDPNGSIMLEENGFAANLYQLVLIC